MDGLADKLTVNEEYIEALRTKSYTDMFNKVQDQMGEIRSLDRLPSSSSRPFRVRLSDYLFEPRPETLTGATRGTNLHHLVIDYLEASYEASNTCELLLGSVHQARANYRIITRAISLPNSTHVFKELSSFASPDRCLSLVFSFSRVLLKIDGCFFALYPSSRMNWFVRLSLLGSFGLGLVKVGFLGFFCAIFGVVSV